MKSRIQHARAALTFSVFALAYGSVLVACDDDAGVDRPAFDDPDSGNGLLPDATTPLGDAGSDADAKAPFSSADESVVCDGGPCAVEIVAGDYHFCARLADGTVRCWGDDGYGSLGGSTGDAGVTGITGATQISAGSETTCALADGGVTCWGGNRKAERAFEDNGLPTADEAAHPEPTTVPLAAFGTPARVDVGNGHVCVHLTDSKLVCWGYDDKSQLARPSEGDLVDVFPAARLPGVSEIAPLSVAQVAASTHTTVALAPNGEVWSWGELMGNDGLLGGRVSSISPQPSPRKILDLANVTEIAASPWVMIDKPGFPPPPPVYRAHACVIASGEVFCWGESQAGALCTGLPDVEKTPRHAPTFSRAWPQQLAVQDEITCARLTDGTIHCCGSNLKGRLGTTSPMELASYFTQASAFTGYAVHVAASKSAVCALVKDGTVECWGSNERGELGIAADDLTHSSPRKIAF